MEENGRIDELTVEKGGEWKDGKIDLLELIVENGV